MIDLDDVKPGPSSLPPITAEITDASNNRKRDMFHGYSS